MPVPGVRDFLPKARLLESNHPQIFLEGDRAVGAGSIQNPKSAIQNPKLAASVISCPRRAFRRQMGRRGTASPYRKKRKKRLRNCNRKSVALSGRMVILPPVNPEHRMRLPGGKHASGSGPHKVRTLENGGPRTPKTPRSSARSNQEPRTTNQERKTSTRWHGTCSQAGDSRLSHPPVFLRPHGRSAGKKSGSDSIHKNHIK